ncbi:RNA polymerase sigma factor [bacterium]
MQEKDNNFYWQFVRENKDMVYNIAFQILGNDFELEDVVQEVFLKVYKKLDKFQGKSSIKTWLYRITVNTCLDVLKKKKRNKTVSLDESINNEQTNENVLNDLVKRDMNQRIGDAVSKLPDKYKVILKLKDMENLSYEEISKIMKISMSKVKVWLFRARQKIKANLGGKL